MDLSHFCHSNNCSVCNHRTGNFSCCNLWIRDFDSSSSDSSNYCWREIDSSYKRMKKEGFKQIRFSIYFAFFISGIIIQWLAPFPYKCNFADERCFACGLRTAVNLLLQGKFSTAYRSNKLIVVLVVAAAIMAVHVLSYLYRRGRAKRGLTA